MRSCFRERNWGTPTSKSARAGSGSGWGLASASVLVAAAAAAAAAVMVVVGGGVAAAVAAVTVTATAVVVAAAAAAWPVLWWRWGCQLHQRPAMPPAQAKQEASGAERQEHCSIESANGGRVRAEA